jgi:(R,R)-butanediol dehydrogenase/meso-butanediol dehydrogenase/diacetyl reductase
VRAAVVGVDQQISVQEWADPTPGPGEIVVRITACGICGSDLKARGAMPPGTIMGHEFCGEVVAIGTGTSGAWREGMRAAVLPVFSCGSCNWCRTGEVAHCESARLIGLGGSAGGLAELAAVSGDLAFPVPESLPEEFGALVEPFAVGLHTARIAHISPGDSVLIVGGGPVGLTTARWAYELGASEVVLSDPLAARRELAMGLGATRVVDPSGDELGRGYDVVVECVGKPGLLDQCVSAAATKGRIVVAGVCGEPDPYSPIIALLKELTIAFSVYYRPEEFEHVIDAFVSGRIDPSLLVTRTVGLDQVQSAFDQLAASTDDGKVLVNPHAGSAN